MKKPQTHAADKVLKNQILQLLRLPKYQPLDKVELSKKLGLPSDRRAELREVLRGLEQRGEIARIRKDRYVLPETADLVTGILQVHRSGRAHLVSERAGEADLFISAENTWTAMNHDRVVARVMQEGVEGIRQSARGEKPSAKVGRVIRILQRANETIVGTVQQSKKFFYVIPDDSHLVHHIYVNQIGAARLNDKVVVKLDPWESRHVNPEGEIIEVLGAADAPGVDMLSIIRKHHFATEFPAAVWREAEKISETIDPRELEQREDLRAQMIVTIDPDDAKDFDDAIFVEKHANGWRLGVHIADVSHYVKHGNALDREAFQRGNSVYLADRVIPMLPEKLSNGICSLKPKVDRLTRSAFIEFTAAGKIKSARFAHTVIRSAARLTYKEAFAILNGGSAAPGDLQENGGKSAAATIADRLHTAWELASLLRKNRFAAGSLDLDFPEVKVWLDEQGRPVRLEKIGNDISHQLIEEFMLAANECVAYAIKNRQLPSIYRVHEDPDADRLAEYRELAMSYGCKAGDLTNRREVQRFLASIRGRDEEHALKIGFLKSLKRATYDVKPIGHYGLAKTNYTHFTSPIRRYADLVVHRVLAHLENGKDRINRMNKTSVDEEDAFSATKSNSENFVNSVAKNRVVPVNDLVQIAEHISLTERAAADAEKESVRLKKLEFFQNQLRQKKPGVFAAVVVDVRSYGILIELPDALISGLIHVSALADDFYLFDAARLRFVGRRNRRIFKIGDKLSVCVARVDIYKQQMDFFPAE